jgi:hypothetical protein
MTNLLAPLTSDELSALYDYISDEWDAVWKLWTFVGQHGGCDTDDLRDYCSDLSSILADINDAPFSAGESIVKEIPDASVAQLLCCDEWVAYPTQGISAQCPVCKTVFSIKES